MIADRVLVNVFFIILYHIQVSLEMAARILWISSPTHRIRQKHTETMATVELAEPKASLVSVPTQQPLSH